ncbi:hypothetical protein GCM10009643_18870 [Microbacterium aurantiacum]
MILVRDRVGAVSIFAAVRVRPNLGLLAGLTATVALSVTTVVVALTWLDSARTYANAALSGEPTDLTTSVAPFMAAAPALVMVVALLAGASVGALARLLTVARAHATATLRGRGLSRSQAWVAACVEGASVALIGGFVGAGVGIAVAGVDETSSARVAGWAAATAALLAIVHAVSSRREESSGVSTRSTRAIKGTVPIVVIAVAAFAVWQLPNARGVGFDPVVTIAPAAVLLAGAMGVILVFGVLAALFSRVASSWRGLSPGLPARQVSRRIGVFAVAVLLVAFTSAQTVFVSAYDATWQRMTADSAAVEAGAELRVDAAPSTVSPGDVAQARDVPGVTSASAALSGALEFGDTTAQMVALPVAAAEEVVLPAGGLVDTTALTLAAEQPGTVAADPPTLGEGATGLRVAVSVAGADGRSSAVRVGAVLVDASGAPASVSLESIAGTPEEGGGAVVAETALPEGTDPWRLLAVTTSLPPRLGGSSATVALLSAEGIGGAPLVVGGEVTLDGPGRDGVLWVADGDADGDAMAAPVGAVVSADLAARLGLSLDAPMGWGLVGRRDAEMPL